MPGAGRCIRTGNFYPLIEDITCSAAARGALIVILDSSDTPLARGCALPWGGAAKGVSARA